MNIEIRRRGGFAGIDERVASIDTGRLQGAAAVQIHGHIARLSELLRSYGPSIGADQLRYEIEVTDPAAGSRKLSVPDVGDPNDAALQHVAAILASV